MSVSREQELERAMNLIDLAIECIKFGSTNLAIGSLSAAQGHIIMALKPDVPVARISDELEDDQLWRDHVMRLDRYMQGE